MGGDETWICILYRRVAISRHIIVFTHWGRSGNFERGTCYGMNRCTRVTMEGFAEIKSLRVVICGIFFTSKRGLLTGLVIFDFEGIQSVMNECQLEVGRRIRRRRNTEDGEINGGLGWVTKVEEGA